jgi:hypothetical protein
MPGAALEDRIAELAMAALAPCDLGDGIEVVHDVEKLEIEMDCDIADAPSVEALASTMQLHDEVASTMQFLRQDELASTLQFARQDELASTVEFARFSAPYERIELQLDASAYRRATIEDARRMLRAGSAAEQARQPRPDPTRRRTRVM